MKKYQIKIKIKFLLYNLLGLITLFIIGFIAYLNSKLFETILTIILFYIFRTMYEKQYHASSLLVCSFVSICVFSIVIRLEFKFEASVCFSVVLTYFITSCSYLLKLLIDNTILLNTYRNKLNSLNNKCLENLSEEEMIKLMPSINKDIIELVYGYLHKGKGINASGYARKCNISEPTLYRYVKQVKNKYESLGLKA